MNFKSTTLSLALIALAGTASLAYAHGDGDKGPRGMRGFGPGIEALDTDGDGSVTQAEIDAAWNARFEAADANKDGKLDSEEMLASAETSRMEKQKRGVERMIERLDGDKDGSVTLEEMKAGRTGKMFERLDANEDGAISKEEFEEARANMRDGKRGHKGGDRDGHGKRDGHGDRDGQKRKYQDN